MTPSDIAKTLQKKGQPMTLTRAIAGTFDPVTGGMTGGSLQAFTVYGITKSYKLSDVNAANSLILSGDKQAIIEATVEPLVGNALTVMGEVWQVISVNELSPQGVALMYYCQCRK